MEKTLVDTTFSRKIKEWAGEIGFYSAGIIPASVLFEEDPNLERWNREGHAGGMAYMKDFSGRLKRFRESFPDAASAICLTVSYYSPDERPNPSIRRSGWVARYARGRDYHKVLKRKLKLLIRRMQEAREGPAVFRPFVDTGPLLERKLAAKAGLGFIGKNTTLLGAAGSYLFLAEIVTNLTLDYDEPASPPPSCGSCTLCLEACPTGAIVEPFVIDARRCISYLTIEHRGPVEESLKKPVGNWVFGCDVCIDVCPFNARPIPTPWEELTPKAGVGSELDLQEVLSLGDVAFQKRFQGTPLLRPKRDGLKRNAAIVLENLTR